MRERRHRWPCSKPRGGQALRRGRAQDQRQAYITEISQIGLDPADPFPRGYVLSDT
jgi:hypothetical protein